MEIDEQHRQAPDFPQKRREREKKKARDKPSAHPIGEKPRPDFFDPHGRPSQTND
jgi:hypothetical protein